ncbi:MAG: archaellin/type IV pilin N-terminal domain-containing protein, partial [Thermofilaceae archaeon]|nr:archaellin/type IV pilin N-terminal domain-containing protein [Thermofilaceae archaeon]
MKKGVSPVVATLILVVITVVSVIVSYFWISSYMVTLKTSADQPQIKEMVKIEGKGYTDGKLKVYVQNIGSTKTFIVSIYILKRDNTVVLADNNIGIELEPGQSAVLEVPLPVNNRDQYILKLVTATGVEASTLLDLSTISAVGRGEGESGGEPSPLQATLSLRIEKLDYQGRVVGPAQGVRVRIAEQTHTTDNEGLVRVTLAKGNDYVIEILETESNDGWQRYVFHAWGNGLQDNPLTINLREDIHLTAQVWDKRLLKVSYNTEGGYVKVNGVRVEDRWSSWFKYGTQTTLEAIAHEGYYLDRWERRVRDEPSTEHVTSSLVTLTVDEGYSLHAVFKGLLDFTVEVIKLGKDDEFIGPAPGVTVKIGGKEYTTDGNGRVVLHVPPGTYTVEISQTVFNSGWGRYTFLRWLQGDTVNPKTFQVDNNEKVTAYVADERRVTVTYTPGGVVKVGDDQIPSDWTDWFRYGEELVLEAVPSSGYFFDRWQLGVNGAPPTSHTANNPLTIVVDDGYSINAVFQRLPVIEVKVKAFDNSGNEIGPAANVNVRINTAVYATDQDGRITLEATPGVYIVEILETILNNGWHRYTFRQWGDGSVANPRSFTVSSDTVLTVSVWDERLLKVTYTSGGSVAVDGNTVFNGWTNWYRKGASTTLQASPSSGYYFLKWQRGVNSDSVTDYSTSNPLTVTMDEGYRLHAVFSLPVQLTIQVQRVDKNGNSLGFATNVIVKINGVTYPTNNNGVVSVQVAPGTHTVEIVQTYFNNNWGRYTFRQWGDGSVANPRSFTVSSDTVLT